METDGIELLVESASDSTDYLLHLTLTKQHGTRIVRESA